jgi:hypothetical protein
MLTRRSESSSTEKVRTALLGVGASQLVGLVALTNSWQKATGSEAFMVLGLIAVLAVVSLVLSKIAKFSESAKGIFKWSSLIYAGFGVLTTASYGIVEGVPNDARYYLITSLLIFTIITRLTNTKSRSIPLTLLFFAANLAVTLAGASLAQSQLNLVYTPELYSLSLSAALIISTLLSGEALGKARSILLLEVPVLGSALFSLAYALGSHDQGLATHLREILATGLIAGISVIRLRRNSSEGWIAGAYAATIGFGLSIAWFIQDQLNLVFTPELYSLILSAVIIATTLLTRDALGKAKSILLVEVPVLGTALFSLGYAVFSHETGLATNLREVLSTGLISGLAMLRLRKNPVQGWIIGAYASTVAFTLSISYTISTNWATAYAGPEIYSVLATLAILVVHRLALKHLELKSSLFSWGFPIAVAVLPSIFYTYTTWGLSLSELGVDQILRELVALVVAGALLTLGLLRGNLANASVGITGLALLVIPAVASQSDGLGRSWQVQNTAMVVGILIFAVLSIARLGGKLTGSSRLFLGVPITITLAPALFNALVALGKPELEPLDWWRFGIVLSVSLLMLVLGTMREVAGLFYPGLVGVLLTALPYGFKQTQKDQWFLWVLLLAIAGVMVWLALRLERMRKAGRTSSAWLRELK